MVRYRWFLAGLVVGVLVLAVWWAQSGSGTTVAVDLVERLPQAVLRPAPEAFTALDVTINGDTKRSIFVTQPSRITWTETIPDHGWLDVSLGLREEAWARPGDGVLFLIGVSHSGSASGEGVYDELLSLVVNPYANPADRQWYPLRLDLSPYAGQTVELIFNTRPGPTGDNRDNDLAVWGAPRLVVR